MIPANLEKDSRALEPDDKARNILAGSFAEGRVRPNSNPHSVRPFCWADSMKQMIESVMPTVQNIPSVGRGGMAYGAAQMARFVWNHAKEKRDSYWYVEMDMDRRFTQSEPRFLREKPISMKRGLVGNGLITSAQHVARSHDGSMCWAVVHFCGDHTRKADIRDVVSAKRMVSHSITGCVLPEYCLTSNHGFFMGKFTHVFFVDMILLWRDGSFFSFRESGLVEMDGGDRI